MKKPFIHALFLTAICLFNQVKAADYTSSIAGEAMANAMLLMMEAMGKFASSQRHNRNQAPSIENYTWPPNRPRSYYPPSDTYNTPASILEGTWQGAAGDILIIHGTQYRIFISPEQFTEGYFQIQNGLIAMLSQDARYPRVYEYATQEDKLVLRDDEGQLMMYKLVSRQSPPTPFNLY